jgi:methionyl-tRNA formyltransferase
MSKENRSDKNLRIVFMGTPDFAVASLDAIVQDGWNVVAAVTAPDKPAGRGMKMTPSAVKQYAVEKGIPVLQPEKLKAPEFLQSLQSLHADLQVVVAFRMLPELVWNMPPLGTINLHGSLLPQYRGAAPINWAIMNGETETGVTTFRLKQEIDTGDILLKRSMPIDPEDDFKTVHDRMKVLGAEVLVETIRGLADGTLTPIPQDHINPESLKPAPKIFTDHCRLDWSKPVAALHNQVRGLSPVPGAFTTLHGKMLKIYRSKPVHAQQGRVPGSADTDGKQLLRFAAADGWLEVLELQAEGKKRMPVEDFLRGYRWPEA